MAPIKEAETTITPHIVMESIETLSVTVFSTPTDQNHIAKLQAKEIQCKTKTDRGKEVFLNVCSKLNEKMISIVSSTAS